MKYDVLIIGAGAAGLIAARELSKNGYNVCVLEADSMAGGRIRTLNENGFDTLIETGPEFIHGDLPLTFQLLKEANISITAVAGNMIPVRNGNWNTEDDNEHWSAFMQELYKLKTDMPLQAFLQQYFPGNAYAALHNSVKHFAEGFDLADISKMSCFFVRKEWLQHEEPNYRINGGYSKLIDFLCAACLKNKAVILYNHAVNKVTLNNTSVLVHTTGGEIFESGKVIITVSLGMLQSHAIDISFMPADYSKAINQLGFGAVIKLLLQFKTDFWKSYANNIGFILSDEIIPTWWTQLPAASNMLTGWVGGPTAVQLSQLNDDALLQLAVQSLANIFTKTTGEIQAQLVTHKILCWQNNDFVKGGYSYVTVEAENAKKILAAPINKTVYFAGEAYSTGNSQGTVEAALQSGFETAHKILESNN